MASITINGIPAAIRRTIPKTTETRRGALDIQEMQRVAKIFVMVKRLVLILQDALP